LRVTIHIVGGEGWVVAFGLLGKMIVEEVGDKVVVLTGDGPQVCVRWLDRGDRHLRSIEGLYSWKERLQRAVNTSKLCHVPSACHVKFDDRADEYAAMTVRIQRQ
jgi:hypothetical protein